MRSPTSKELSAVPLFASLTRRELDKAAQLFIVRSYQKNAVVATEGDRLDMFNVILEGRVQAFWRDEEGQQLKLGIDGPGDHFADVTLGGEPALVSFLALSDLRVASIRMIDLRQLWRRHPDVAVVLLMDVVARLRRMVARTRNLTMMDVYGRVVKVLLASSAVDGDGRRASARLTHAEIGQQVGATREMVGRVLRELARGGYIRSERGRITLLKKLPARR
jgi:CRP/FNR family cyclic AMP-dependent transcriptional regulator